MNSQRDEEKYILEACEGSQVRRLLDLGAWDPITFSNSRELLQRGWGGVLVEFSPKPLRALAAAYADRRDVFVIPAAIAVEAGAIEMSVTDDAVSAPSSSKNAAAWATQTTFYGRLLVPTITFDWILSRFGAFDFVSIDTEGTSVDLLKILLATEMFPRCICVEHDGRYIEALAMARARGYKPLYESEENVVLGR